MRLVTPDQVEQAAIDCLRDHHARHLAALERDRGLPRRTIEGFQTVDLLADDEVRLKQDTLPALLLACTDLRSSETDTTWDGREVLNATWQLEAHVFAPGGGPDPRSDAMRRCRWLWTTAAECLLRRLRGAEIVTSLALTAARHETVGEGTFLAHAELLFDVHIDDALTLTGGPISIEDPDDPYAPPVGADPVNDLDVDVTRVPLTDPLENP